MKARHIKKSLRARMSYRVGGGIVLFRIWSGFGKHIAGRY